MEKVWCETESILTLILQLFLPRTVCIMVLLILAIYQDQGTSGLLAYGILLDIQRVQTSIPKPWGRESSTYVAAKLWE